MKKPINSMNQVASGIGAVTALSLLSAPSALGATFYYNTLTTSGINTGANWSDNPTSGGTTGTAPGNSDTGVFNQSTVNGDLIVTTPNKDVGNLVFNNTGTTAIRNNGTASALSLATGITVNSGAGAVTFGQTGPGGNRLNLNLNASQTWTNNSGATFTHQAANNTQISTGGNTLTFDGTGNFQINTDVRGTSGSVIKNGAGQLNFTGTNTYTGSTTVNAGTLNLASAGSLRFDIDGTGMNNSLMNIAGLVNLDGDFVFDLTGAGTSVGDFWNVVVGDALYTGTFGVNSTLGAFTDNGGGIFTIDENGQTYRFETGSGILAVVPEPSTYALFAAGLLSLAFTRRRHL